MHLASFEMENNRHTTLFGLENQAKRPTQNARVAPITLGEESASIYKRPSGPPVRVWNRLDVIAEGSEHAKRNESTEQIDDIERNDDTKRTGGSHKDLNSILPSWNHLFNLELGKGQNFIVAQSNDATHKLSLIQYISGAHVLQKLQFIKGVRHGNMIQKLDEFVVGTHYLVAWEFVPVSLVGLIRSPLLDDLKVASVVGQIIEGLSYLHDKGWEHGSLSCSNVLLDYDGHVKICGYEQSHGLTDDRDLSGLRNVIKELLQGYSMSKLEERDSAIHEALSMTYKLLGQLPEAITDIKQLFKFDLFKIQAWTPQALRGILIYVHYFQSWRADWPAQIEDILRDK